MLTILSVKYGPARLLEWNAELCRALNPDTRYEWLVVNNDADETFAHSTAFTVLPGVPVPPTANPKDRGSAHHAAALMDSLKRVSGRYLLLLDQDFYVVRPGWIARLLAHAEAQRLAFFGSVWHPRWSYQPRGFPSVHFMLIDLEQVPAAALDFRPDMGGDRLDALISHPRLPLPPALRTLLQVGTFRDTGWRVHDRFRTSGLRFECLTPTFDRDAALQEAHPLHRLTARLLPEHRRTIPGDPASFTEQSFLRSVSELAHQRRWEEFFWQGEPFAFHLRSVGRRGAGADEDHAELRRLIEEYKAGM
ncbi:glycosyltransferase family 2 protein [Deinococcus sp. UYEF24]